MTSTPADIQLQSPAPAARQTNPSMQTTETTESAAIIERLRSIDTRIKLLQAEAKSLSAVLADRVTDAMASKLGEQGKTHGSFKLELDGIPVQATITKTVTWDNDRLLALSEQMDSKEAKAIFQAKLSVSEAVFSDLEALEHPILADLYTARTVKYSPLAVKPA